MTAIKQKSTVFRTWSDQVDKVLEGFVQTKPGQWRRERERERERERDVGYDELTVVNHLSGLNEVVLRDL